MSAYIKANDDFSEGSLIPLKTATGTSEFEGEWLSTDKTACARRLRFNFGREC